MSDQQQRTPTVWVGRRARIALAVVGGTSWLGGAAATFLVDGGGSGAGALVLAGVACCAVSLLGRWPSRLRVQGGELVWDGVDKAVESQIAAARKQGDDLVVAELHELRDRLDALRDTGSVPVHPAELYDRAVVEALRRVAPGLHVLRETDRSPDRPDIVLRGGGRDVLVETKWRPVAAGTFHGSTLPPLLSAVGDQPLLVVTNAGDVTAGQSALGTTARVVAWHDPSDDAALAQVLAELHRTPAAR